MSLRFICSLLAIIGGSVHVQASWQKPTPIVLWHGIGDTNLGFDWVKKLIEREINGVYVISLQIGDSTITDMENSFFLHPDHKIDYVCKLLGMDDRLANGYHGIGFSQGGLFLRALAQRCPEPAMKVLTYISGFATAGHIWNACLSETYANEEYIIPLVAGTYCVLWTQNNFVPSTYWHDPLDENSYRSGSTFLSDINNENYINLNYVNNLNKLKKLVLVKFLCDSVVQPMDSEWFEFYRPGQNVEIERLGESRIYKRLGLNVMHAQGKLHFISVQGDHLQMSVDWIVDELVPLLRN